MDTIDFNKQRTSRLSWQSIELRIVLIASLLAIGFVFWILGSMPSSMFWDNINWFGPSHSAITEFTKAVNLEPDNEQAYLLLADAYQLNGDLASVQQVWQDATRKNRDVKWAYKHQAQFHQSFRQNDDVVRTWQQAVFENPYASWGYIELAKFHLLTKTGLLQRLLGNPR